MILSSTGRVQSMVNFRVSLDFLGPWALLITACTIVLNLRGHARGDRVRTAPISATPEGAPGGTSAPDTGHWTRSRYRMPSQIDTSVRRPPPGLEGVRAPKHAYERPPAPAMVPSCSPCSRGCMPTPTCYQVTVQLRERDATRRNALICEHRSTALAPGSMEAVPRKSKSHPNQLGRSRSESRNESPPIAMPA